MLIANAPAVERSTFASSVHGLRSCAFCWAEASEQTATGRVHARGRWCTFGAAVSGTTAKVTFYEYGEDGSVLHRTKIDLKVRP